MVARQAKQRILSLEGPHFNRLRPSMFGPEVDVFGSNVFNDEWIDLGKTIVAQSRRSKHEKARYSAEGE